MPKKAAAALAVRTADADAVELAQQHPQLFAQWQNGDLRPAAITHAFNPSADNGRWSTLFSSTQFQGTWVDHACGAHDPAVDRWEQGLLYPSWEQLCKLSALTQTPLTTLLNSPDTPNLLNGCSQEATSFALRQNFHPYIVAAAVDSHPKETSPEAMTTAINQALAAFQQSIQAETDPLSLFTKKVLGLSDPGANNTSQP